jgi:hypothetical protein
MQKIFIINKLLFFRVWWAVVLVKKYPQGLEKNNQKLSKSLLHPATVIFKNIYILSKHGIQARNDSHSHTVQCEK